MRRSRVFISYRRVDGSGQAGRLQEDLLGALGCPVFMDVTGIEPGRDFEIALRAELQSCRVVLAVIGRDWTQILRRGEQRADVDFVRFELGEALRDEEVSVIPLLVEGAGLPSADELPEDLRDLVRRQAFSIRDDRWQRDVEDLAVELRRLLGVGRFRALLRRAPWLAPLALVGAAVLALVAWVAIQSLPPPDPGPRLPFDRDMAHQQTIAATRKAVKACRGRDGAAGECPVLFKLLDSGKVGEVYYPVGYCGFKGSAFGDCLLRELSSAQVRPFRDLASAEVQLDINVSPDAATVEVDE
ncbi:MAG TPA: toll/interleukin-1 receptor domain-containing protein [Candidatus Dormibacteraeota bacterium]|nr:toll/interleukin-1 receptor domain-containing protein [Candidatus Dormibacteraeota bacterium]